MTTTLIVGRVGHTTEAQNDAAYLSTSNGAATSSAGVDTMEERTASARPSVTTAPVAPTTTPVRDAVAMLSRVKTDGALASAIVGTAFSSTVRSAPARITEAKERGDATYVITVQRFDMHTGEPFGHPQKVVVDGSGAVVGPLRVDVASDAEELRDLLHGDHAKLSAVTGAAFQLRMNADLRLAEIEALSDGAYSVRVDAVANDKELLQTSRVLVDARGTLLGPDERADLVAAMHRQLAADSQRVKEYAKDAGLSVSSRWSQPKLGPISRNADGTFLVRVSSDVDNGEEPQTVTFKVDWKGELAA